jgi:hypothetical protein
VNEPVAGSSTGRGVPGSADSVSIVAALRDCSAVIAAPSVGHTDALGEACPRDIRQSAARARRSEGGLVLRRIDRVDAPVLDVATDPLATDPAATDPAAADPLVPDPLAPVHAALAAAFPANPPGGLAPGLTVIDGPGWICAQGMADGTRVPELLAAVGLRRRASPHATAALAWKAYTFALALPAVLGWAAARRVPLVRPADVLVHLHLPGSVLMLGLRPSIRVAVLPSDPLATARRGTSTWWPTRRPCSTCCASRCSTRT